MGADKRSSCEKHRAVKKQHRSFNLSAQWTYHRHDVLLDAGTLREPTKLIQRERTGAVRVRVVPQLVGHPDFPSGLPMEGARRACVCLCVSVCLKGVGWVGYFLAERGELRPEKRCAIVGDDGGVYCETAPVSDQDSCASGLGDLLRWRKRVSPWKDCEEFIVWSS